MSEIDHKAIWSIIGKNWEHSYKHQLWSGETGRPSSVAYPDWRAYCCDGGKEECAGLRYCQNKIYNVGDSL